MPTRKKTPKRDPSREPYASRYSDDQRGTLDTASALAEIQRATRKSEAARQQTAGGRKLFVSPEASDASAMATVSTHLSMVKMLAEWGEKFDHPRRRGAVDDLSVCMKEIMRERPAISCREMFDSLARLVGDHSVVQEVADEMIYFKSKGIDKGPIGKRAVQDRMTRIRKFLAEE